MKQNLEWETRRGQAINKKKKYQGCPKYGKQETELDQKQEYSNME